MKITKTVETKDGEVMIDAVLTPEEANFIMEVGLNFVLAAGSVPMLERLKKSAVPEITPDIPDNITIQ